MRRTAIETHIAVEIMEYDDDKAAAPLSWSSVPLLIVSRDARAGPMALIHDMEASMSVTTLPLPVG